MKLNQYGLFIEVCFRASNGHPFFSKPLTENSFKEALAHCEFQKSYIVGIKNGEDIVMVVVGLDREFKTPYEKFVRMVSSGIVAHY